MKQFATLLDGDGNLMPLDEDNKDKVKVDAFLSFFVQFGNQRVRFENPEEPPAKKVKMLYEAERAAASFVRSREANDDTDDDCDDY